MFVVNSKLKSGAIHWFLFSVAVLMQLWIVPAQADAGAEEVASTSQLPAIYIERKIDRSRTQIPFLRRQYEWCVREKLFAREAFRENGIAWGGMKEALSEEYLMGIKADPVAEPDWEKAQVGVSFEEEYFHGDKYKHIMRGKKFRISENDGLCRLETYGDYEKQDIDDGVNRYKVTLKNLKEGVGNVSGENLRKKDIYKTAKVKQSISPVRVRQQSDKQLGQLAREYPDLFEKMTNKMFTRPGAAVPEPGSGWKGKASKKDVELIGEVFQIRESPGQKTGLPVPVSDYEHIIQNQLCDIVESGLTNGRIWYWKKMHHYPSIMERPIILKKEQKLSSRFVIEEATRFEVRKQFSKSVFLPPPGIKVKQRKQNRMLPVAPDRELPG